MTYIAPILGFGLGLLITLAVLVITTGSTHVRQEVELFRTRDRCENALVQYAPTVKPPAIGSGSVLKLECEGFPVPLRHFFKAEREA